ncbi:MAG: NUDIX domain-containing protein [Spirochaetales bacterium]|nr:NUDIX domain-containing protein [Spirochaetales bacterium]
MSWKRGKKYIPFPNGVPQRKRKPGRNNCPENSLYPSWVILFTAAGFAVISAHGKIRLKCVLSARQGKSALKDLSSQSRTVAGVDWDHLNFTEKAVLCFIVKEGRVLLIHKKQGLGKGKINAPGGRLEPGETNAECAIRETEEEVGVTPFNPVKKGELNFIFTDGFSLFCSVFIAGDFSGTPYETDEAVPVWFNLSEIPYDKMWEDDRYWLPILLEDGRFTGFFVFEEDSMLDMLITRNSSFIDG